MLQQLSQIMTHSFINPMSPQTQAVSNLFWVGGTIALIIFLIPTAILAYTLLRFRYRPGQGEPRQDEGSPRLEIIWTVIPTIIVLVIFGLSLRTQGLAEPNTDPAPYLTGMHPAQAAAPPDLTIVGHQWWWELRYRSGVVSANEVHIPLRTRWLVALQSADVVHGFWVPQIGNQMYLIPGQTNHIWLEADRPGLYEGQCAEFCGAAHAWMLLRVIAETPAQFAAWQREQRRPASALGSHVASAGPPAGATANTLGRLHQPVSGTRSALIAGGAQLFQQLSCQVCHAIAGTAAHGVIGPDLTHLGSRTTLAAGRLPNTPTALMAWLHDPQAVKEGNHMPNLLLTPAQIRALTAYLESLT